METVINMFSYLGEISDYLNVNPENIILFRGEKHV